jgi:16S rRNA (cytidine1402-2'-O)-methyltransferase
VAALSASGLPTDSFLFHGFLPAKQGQRRKLLERLKALEATLVFYEAPHRILETLQDIAETLGPRRVVLARELTKIHEEFLSGTPEELIAALNQRFSMKGEFTVMIAKSEAAERDETPLDAAVENLIQAGVPRMEALKTVARQRGLSKREVYKKLNER